MSEQKGCEVRMEEKLQELNYVTDGTEQTQELKPIYTTKRTDTWFLYFTVILVQGQVLISGAGIVWTSPVIPLLLSNDTLINPIGHAATTLDISMIAGIPLLLTHAGGIVLPRFSDVFGRKMFVQVMVWGVLSSLILLAFSTSIIMIIISRSLLAFVLAGSTTVIPIYTTELCEDHNRAKFGCFFGILHQIGHLYMFVIGPLSSFRTLSFLIALITVPLIITFPFLPESPIYLLSKGKRSDCIRALKKLRSNKNDKELTNDLNQLEQILKDRQMSKDKPSFISIFRIRETRIGLMLATLPLLVQHLSGVAVIMAFLAPFFNSAGTSLSGNTVAIIVGITKTSCFTFTSLVVEKLGRKKMLLFSAIATGFPLFAFACFFYLKHINSPLIDQLQWMPLTCLLLNVVMYSTGLGPIPTAIMNEMLPSEYRAVASCLISIIVGAIVFILTFCYPLVAASIGVHWAMFLFSGNCFVGALMIYYFLPETNGKTLQEIQDIVKNY